jgi:hypothetical protein
MATASLIGRRFGPAVSGWLVGIPFTSGPITLFLYLDHGASFAAHAALGSLIGVLATIAWAVEYSAFAKRRARLVVCVPAGIIAFALIGAAAQDLAIAPIPLYAICALALAVALRIVRAPWVAHGVHPPRWDLPARMVIATVLVLAITSAASLLGPRVSGLLATIPLYASILAAFAHRQIGPLAAVQVWRGLLFGLFGFGAFYLVLAAGLESLGPVAFVVALAAAFVAQAITLRALHRSAASSRTDGTRSDASA